MKQSIKQGSEKKKGKAAQPAVNPKTYKYSVHKPVEDINTPFLEVAALHEELSGTDFLTMKKQMRKQRRAKLKPLIEEEIPNE